MRRTPFSIKLTAEEHNAFAAAARDSESISAWARKVLWEAALQNPRVVPEAEHVPLPEPEVIPEDAGLAADNLAAILETPIEQTLWRCSCGGTNATARCNNCGAMVNEE